MKRTTCAILVLLLVLSLSGMASAGYMMMGEAGPLPATNIGNPAGYTAPDKSGSSPAFVQPKPVVRQTDEFFWIPEGVTFCCPACSRSGCGCEGACATWGWTDWEIKTERVFGIARMPVGLQRWKWVCEDFDCPCWDGELYQFVPYALN